ncbi:MAG: cytidine deaminase [Verrucomicrobia subdivision 3 bacterium]|nr:cytidine deaminase [Limisphaerales bacterium]
MKARLRAVAPYSRFRVGAALVANSGKVYLGANVESASYGLSCCAERIALFKALTDGERRFGAIAVVAPVAGGPMPCGACRQLLAEYAPEAVFLTADSRKPSVPRKFEIKSLLPEAFTLRPLEVSKLRKQSEY